MKTPATMTVLLFAATIGLEAQTSASSSAQQTEEQRRRDQSTWSSASPSSSQSSASTSATTPKANETDQERRDREAREKKDKDNRYSSTSSSTSSSPASASTSSSDELKYRSNQPGAQSQASTSGQTGSQTSAQTGSQTTAQTGSQSSTQFGAQSNTSAQTNVALNTEVDAEVRTVVQQIDAQGPVVVERITTRFADVTCTEENARALVEALHNGTSVTLRGDDGQTATFTPSARLGYGEAYIAMSLAAEALKQAGITGCASPAQWQAVLMGGQLSGGTVTTTSVSTERFPGILVLREQGGWAKVAQTTNIQLSQVVSQANTNLQLNNTSSTASTSTTSQENLSEVGRPRDYDPRASDKSGKDDDKKDKKDKKDHEDHGMKKGHETNASDMENPPKSEATPPKKY